VTIPTIVAGIYALDPDSVISPEMTITVSEFIKSNFKAGTESFISIPAAKKNPILKRNEKNKQAKQYSFRLSQYFPL
jgi:phage anti-repressor protein